MAKKHNSKVVKAAYEKLFDLLDELHEIIIEKKKEAKTQQTTIEIK